MLIITFGSSFSNIITKLFFFFGIACTQLIDGFSYLSTQINWLISGNIYIHYTWYEKKKNYSSLLSLIIIHIIRDKNTFALQNRSVNHYYTISSRMAQEHTYKSPVVIWNIFSYLRNTFANQHDSCIWISLCRKLFTHTQMCDCWRKKLKWINYKYIFHTISPLNLFLVKS